MTKWDVCKDFRCPYCGGSLAYENDYKMNVVKSRVFCKICRRHYKLEVKLTR